MAKNFPNRSELLFGNDLNKRIPQINNTSNPLLTKPSHTVVLNKPATNQTGKKVIKNGLKIDFMKRPNITSSKKCS